MPANKSTKPAKKSAPKKSAPKKTVPTVVETPVVDTPVVDTPVVDTTTGNNVPVAPEMFSYDTEFDSLNAQLKDAMNLIKSIVTDFNTLQKKVARDKKVVDKKMKNKVKRPHDPNKPPSGFAKPGKVSDELRKFLGLEADVLVARTTVTKSINAYCKEHELQNPEDKRQIKPDAALKKLLRVTAKDELTFFNLQKYLKPHYPNKEGVFAN